MSLIVKKKIPTAHKSNSIKKAEAKARIKEDYRICLGCNEHKHESNYYKDHESRCRPCLSKYHSEWYHENKKRINARRKELYKLKKQANQENLKQPQQHSSDSRSDCIALQ